ncbi:hypothetical protein JCM8547_008280 [Rhodosporidiobolus lusitaniae]
MPVKLSIGLRERLTLFSKPPSPSDPPLRLPLELILHILSLASASFAHPDLPEAEHFRASLARVSRLFSHLYARRKWRTVGMESGAQLVELLQRLKMSSKEEKEWIEGVEVDNLAEYYSRKRLFEYWGKFVKTCPNVGFVQLGCEEVEQKMYEQVEGYDLCKMRGITTLRLINVVLGNHSPPGKFYKLKPPPRTPLIPSGLRHLVLSNTWLEFTPDVTISSLWPVEKDVQLVSLFLANLKAAGFSIGRDTLVPACTELVRRASSSLVALHFSRKLKSFDPVDPLFTSDFSLPKLRILSLSIKFLAADALKAVPQVEYLALTLCDFDVDYLAPQLAAIQAAVDLLLPVFSSSSPSPLLQNLRTLVLPVPYIEAAGSLRGMYGEVREKAEGRGVKVEFAVAGEEDVETKFRLMVREELGEKM